MFRFRSRSAALAWLFVWSASLAATPASAAFELGFFVAQRNVFVLSTADSDSLGLVREITGLSTGDVGLAKRFSPYGLSADWYLRGYKMTGPLARLRLAPWAAQIRADRDRAEGWDAQAQVGHSWSGPSMGSLSMAFEFGTTLRRFVSGDESAVSSTGLAGLFWGWILTKDLWNAHAEASLLALSLGSDGRWGKHRDSNSFRLQLSRQLDEASPWRAFVEYYRLHRSFTGSEYAPPASFVSDVSLSLGIVRSI